MFCAKCGKAMTGNWRKSHGKVYKTYRCPNHRNGGCETKELPAKNIDVYVSRVIALAIVRKKSLPALNNLLKNASHDESQPLYQQLYGKERALDNLSAQIEKFGPSQSLSKRCKQLEAQKQQIESKIAQLPQNPFEITEENRRPMLHALSQFLRSDDPDARRILQATIQSIKVSNNDVTLTLKT